MSSSLAGRSVIVTGGSKGIGKGIARVFGKAGSKVLIVSRNIAEAEAAAEEIRRGGGTAMGFAADISDAGGTQMMAEAALSAFGAIDVLCANAGIFPQAKIEDLSPEDWDHVLSTNLKGTFLSLKSCLPYLNRSLN
jgi:3-oxoacyl-[acyl-carrier protein] reductase